MIEKMSKLTLLVDEASSKSALKSLRKLGLLHVKPLPNPPSNDMSEIEGQLESSRNMLNILGDPAEIKQNMKGNASRIVDSLLEATQSRSVLKQELEVLKDMESWYAEWSKVSLDDLAALEEKGFYIKLYQLSPAAWKAVQENENLFALSETKESVKVAMLSRDPEEALDHRPVDIPEMAYDKVLKRIGAVEKELAKIEELVEKNRDSIDLLKTYIETLECDLKFANIQNGLGISESIAWLQGYAPAEDTLKIEQAAAQNSWGYVEEEPTEEDNPPTKLKNKKWIRIIEPVFDFLGTTPGYREKDISMYFLIFFAIFVAMIIGDAGYGMIFFLVSIFATFKTTKGGKKLPDTIILLYVLSLTTIGWGAVTGTWFGSISEGSFLNSLVVDALRNQNNVQLICFILAVLQLGLASIMNFIDNLPKLKAFEHIGWFNMTLGAFLLVLQLVLGENKPPFIEPFMVAVVPLMASGFLLVVFFSAQEPGKSFFKGVAGGLGGAFNTFLDSISSFSNIISYIRLFAVGMASVAIADSFNSMASGLMHGPAIIGGVIVLLIGHGLNLVMGLLSVMVHGIRLNLLEFSGQLGLEWTGYKYEPFKDNKKEII